MLLRRLLATDVVPRDDYEALTGIARQVVDRETDDALLLTALQTSRLLTEYQVSRVKSGWLHGLVLGNYRVLDRIGAGGMGVVYKAEHRQLRNMVAVKVLHPSSEPNSRTLARFYRESRTLGQLKHANIVVAIDAGEEPASGPDSPPIPYFVMELLAGNDLEKAVAEGPLAIGFACHLAHQIADALMEAHRHALIHRDIKPSNIIVTPEGQAKLLDFGLVKNLGQERLTRTGAHVGTIGYMAPEQAGNGSQTVDARADVFGLGATLFYAITGKTPFSGLPTNASKPPSARMIRPDVPDGLDSVLSRMMAIDPEHRYPSAEAVMRALLPYLPATTARSVRAERPTGGKPATPIVVPASDANANRPAQAGSQPGLLLPRSTADIAANRVLIVDDQADIRRFYRLALVADGLVCDEAGTGPEAVELASKNSYDLVLLDVGLDGSPYNGEEVLRRLRQKPVTPHQKVVMISGQVNPDELSRILLVGADDFIVKPPSVVQLRARVKAALRLKDAQDRSDVLNRELLQVNAELEQALGDRDGELIRARNGLVLALAKLVEHRSAETGAHLMRLQRYCRVLAEEAATLSAFAPMIDTNFIRTLEDAAPLHDIGKAALPDHVLNKPGPLDPNERIVMQAHTTIGSDTLREVARRYPFATGFLHMAVDIARSHHERWDGVGYPDRLAGDRIPLSARLLAIADVYDALRSRRVYKPGLTHSTAVMTMTEGSTGHFDPALLEVFRKIADQFDRVFRDCNE